MVVLGILGFELRPNCSISGMRMQGPSGETKISKRARPTSAARPQNVVVLARKVPVVEVPAVLIAEGESTRRNGRSEPLPISIASLGRDSPDNSPFLIINPPV